MITVLRTASEKPGVFSSFAKLSSPQNTGSEVGSIFQLKKLRKNVRSSGPYTQTANRANAGSR